MTPAAHVSAAIEVLDALAQRRRPAADALKDWGASHRFAGSKDRAAIASLVADSYTWFKELVRDRRKLDDAELAKVTDGRVFTARQGLPLKLVDVIGGEREAIAWLETNKKLDKDLPVRDWKKKTSIERLGLVEGAAGVARAFGLDAAAGLLEQAAGAERSAGLDGLLAIWQGSDTR